MAGIERYGVSVCVCVSYVSRQLAVTTWGVRQLLPLDAEDRLSIACEKGVSEDPVILALRDAFQVRVCVCVREHTHIHGYTHTCTHTRMGIHAHGCWATA